MTGRSLSAPRSSSFGIGPFLESGRTLLPTQFIDGDPVFFARAEGIGARLAASTGFGEMIGSSQAQSCSQTRLSLGMNDQTGLTSLRASVTVSALRLQLGCCQAHPY